MVISNDYLRRRFFNSRTSCLTTLLSALVLVLIVLLSFIYAPQIWLAFVYSAFGLQLFLVFITVRIAMYDNQTAFKRAARGIGGHRPTQSLGSYSQSHRNAALTTGPTSDSAAQSWVQTSTDNRADQAAATPSSTHFGSPNEEMFRLHREIDYLVTRVQGLTAGSASNDSSTDASTTEGEVRA